jgi:eukaryotic-like serine/threonine-protein kinase
MIGCSSNEMLSRLLEDQLDREEHASIVDHIETCPSCQERLKDLTSDDSQLPGWGSFEESNTDPWFAKDSHPSSACVGRQFFATGSEALYRRFSAETFEANFPNVDGYEILTELGHGGMGVVYKANQQRLSRMVALKMIRAGSLAKAEDRARFRVEAEAVAELRHPNIIQIYDIGEVGALPFVALELLEGGSLDDLLAGTPQPGRQSALMVATLARAIHVAHQAGIIHRDLKPSNVLFAAEGTPKITDFGLAKRMDDDGYTKSGQVLGSPSYIPPEQAAGAAKKVGPAADVYALGAILYEMLTGRPPFKGTTPVETVMQVLNEDPVPPCRLQSQIPRDLETICLKCLAKEPSKRYPSAKALADDLDRYLANEPVLARRTPVWELGLKWVRRRPTTASLLAIGFLMASWVALFFAFEENRVVDLKNASERVLSNVRDHLLAGSLSSDDVDELVRLEEALKSSPRLSDQHSRAAQWLEKIKHHRVERQAEEAARDRYRQFIRRHDDALFEDTQLTGLDPAESLKVIRKSARATLAIFAGDEWREDEWTLQPLQPSLSPQQQNEVTLGCYEMLMVLADAVSQPLPDESADRQAEAALRILDRAAELRHRPTQAYHLRRAACLEATGDTEGARREAALAERIQPDGAFDHFLSGLQRYKRGLLAQASSHFQQALESQPNHFWAQCLLAICDLNTGKNLEEAKAHLSSCLQSHPDLAWLYLLRGFASGQMGMFDVAEADYREAMERDSAGRFRYALLANRGFVRSKSGKTAEAIADVEEAIKLNPHHYMALVTRAEIYRKDHRIDQAIEQLDRAIALKPHNLGRLVRMRALWNLDRTDLTPAVRATALGDLERAIELDSPGSAELAKDLAKKAQILLAERRYAEVLHSCDRALKIVPDDLEAHRTRVAALLEMKRYQDVIASVDGYLRASGPSAELLGLRGVAKSKRNDFAGAAEDYTLALAVQPKASNLHAHRGWAYLVSGLFQPAQRDFEQAIRLDSSNADAYSGRGSARVALGHYQEAVADADESLRHGEPDARLLYNGARIMAQAAELAGKGASPKVRLGLTAVRQYEDRALKLLGQAIERTPREQRTVFWRDVIRADHALSAIRRLPEYTRWAAEYAATAR